MEEKDPSLMSFPCIPPNFISLQKLQQLRLQEKEDANKIDEVRVTSLNLKREEENHNKVTDKPRASNRYNNHKKWVKGGREEVGILKTVEPVDFEKSKNKEKEEKEEEITKPTTSNGFYNNKKWQNERRIRKEGVFLITHETDDFEESDKSKEREKEENQEKLHEDEEITKPISFNGFYKKNHWIKVEEKLGLGLKSSEEIDLDKAEKKKKKKDEKNEWWKKRRKEWKLRKKLDRQGIDENAGDEKEIKLKEDKDGISVNPTVEIVVDENASDEKEIKSKEDKDGISVNPTVEIVVDDDKKKKTRMKEEEEVNGDYSWRKKKQPFIAATTSVLSNQTAEIVRKFDVISVVGNDQKGMNRRSKVGMNRGFGGGFGNRRNVKGRGGEDDGKNLMWVKKGENMNSNGGNPS